MSPLIGRRPYLDADGEVITGPPTGSGTQPQPRELFSDAGGGRSVVLPLVREESGGSRTVGVYDVTSGGLRWHPAVDVQRLAERGQVVAVVSMVAVTAGWVARGWAQGRPAVGRVTMGPGGWISVRVPRAGSGRRDIRPHAADRPLWARLAGADRLIVAPTGRR